MTPAILDAARARPLFDAERFLAPEPFVRPLIGADWPLLASMTAETPAGWGRPGDAGVVALGPDGEPLGAAWYRLRPAADPPEVTLAVRRDRRHPEVGGVLLAALIRRARAEGHRRLALADAPQGSLRAFYRRYRFRDAGGSRLVADLEAVGGSGGGAALAPPQHN